MHKEIIVFILNSKKEVLLQKRSATKLHHPNKWALCSGHVEGFDEDFECAAIRELKEELGLDVELKTYPNIGHSISTDGWKYGASALREFYQKR